MDKAKNDKITIAIDGYASTGKSTVAKRLAKELHYIYVDTGAMYRAVTYFALQNDLIGDGYFKQKELIERLTEITLAFHFNPATKTNDIYLNGLNVEKEIRSLEVSNFVSPVSTLADVRKYLVSIQREMGKNKGVVMDGRDIGSVVFPDAELKIFFTADAKIRAERRLLELLEKGEKVDFESIYQNVLARDQIDSNRKESPLFKTDDAIEIDATCINKEEQYQKVWELAQKAIKTKLDKRK